MLLRSLCNRDYLLAVHFIAAVADPTRWESREREPFCFSSANSRAAFRGNSVSSRNRTTCAPTTRVAGSCSACEVPAKRRPEYAFPPENALALKTTWTKPPLRCSAPPRCHDSRHCSWADRTQVPWRGPRPRRHAATAPRRACSARCCAAMCSRGC